MPPPRPRGVPPSVTSARLYPGLVFEDIHIRDLGVIADAVLDLAPGLTVVTGETGAGKTMVVQGLGLLAGARADPTLVRSGTQAALVEAVVLSPGPEARARAAAAGVEGSDEEMLVARTVGAHGRSRAHLDGRMVPIAVLAQVGEALVAVHGQAGQWRLRNADQHRDLLDAYAGQSVAAPLSEYRDRWEALQRLEAQLTDALRDDADRERELQQARELVEAVDAVHPEPGEDEALAAEEQRLGHADGLRQAVAQAHAVFGGADEASAADRLSVSDAVARARRALATALEHDPGLREVDKRLADVGYLAADLVVDLARYVEEIDTDPSRLAWVQQRRADLAALTRRHGGPLADLLDRAARAERRLADLAGASERAAALAGQRDVAVADLAGAADRLSRARRSAAARLADDVTAELQELAMGRARLDVVVERAPDPDGLAMPDGTSVRAGRRGVDEVEIRLSDGAGDDRSITRSASGGELSRIMLALEVVIAACGAQEPPGCLVFDEIDAGVGGEAGLAVGARLARLARHTQVVVVTHLAQVAAYADRHLVVTKQDDGAVTASSIRHVDGPDRLAELARMMGGDANATAGLEHAADLLARTRPARLDSASREIK